MRRLTVAIAILSTCVLSAPKPAACLDAETSLPGYQWNRADEDYRYLRDEKRRTDFWDPVKYIPLDYAGERYLSLGGEARLRYEYFNNPDWGSDPQDSGYLLQRYFLHADLHLGDNLRLFSQLQSSLEDGRRGGPRTVDRDDLDLHQAFLDVKLGLGGSDSFTLRSGRQELSYGSQRLISLREGPNVRRSFDGLRGMYRAGDVSLDAFAARPAETRRHVFDDGTDKGQTLWGLYSVLPMPLLREGKADLYYVGLLRRTGRFDQGNARETRHSIGSRIWRTHEPLDYNFEFIYQWGSFGDGEIRAWTAASDTGYSWAGLPLKPRLALKANIASGDEDPDDRDLQTFNPLFPKGAYFSENGLIGPANFFDVNPTLELNFPLNLSLTANWDFFWRESTRDGIYDSAVTLARSGGNTKARYIGSQPQVQLEWDIQRHFVFVANLAHFFAGPFLRDTGPGKDVDYFSTWLTYKF